MTSSQMACWVAAMLLPIATASYAVTLKEHSPEPVLSLSNPVGSGNSPCIIFNPSYIPASATFSKPGLLVRQCCGPTCAGHGMYSSLTDTADRAERIGFAPCSLETGKCEDVLPSSQFNLDPSADAEDPRAFYYEGYYWLFYYRSPKIGECQGKECLVRLVKSQTPLKADSWQQVGTYNWHRNGCCAMKPVGQRSYCIWGEGPGPFPGLGISYTTDISKGMFTQAKWSLGDGMDNSSSPLSPDGSWLLPLGADEEEVKLEAGAHPMQLSTGDWIHLYAAATPGWVPNGNYTVGYLILDKDDPSKILKRSPQFMIPTYDYETLCSGSADCKYKGERKNVIFMSSATPTGVKDQFRLFFGGGDGNVGTALLEVSAKTGDVLAV